MSLMRGEALEEVHQSKLISAFSAERPDGSRSARVGLLPRIQAGAKKGDFLSSIHWCTSDSHPTALFGPAVQQMP